MVTGFSDVRAETDIDDLYSQKERIESLKQTAESLFYVVENDATRENIKIALTNIIDTAERIEERIDNEIECIIAIQEEEVDEPTLGEENALRSAQTYLDFQRSHILD